MAENMNETQISHVDANETVNTVETNTNMIIDNSQEMPSEQQPVESIVTPQEQQIVESTEELPQEEQSSQITEQEQTTVVEQLVEEPVSQQQESEQPVENLEQNHSEQQEITVEEQKVETTPQPEPLEEKSEEQPQTVEEQTTEPQPLQEEVQPQEPQTIEQSELVQDNKLEQVTTQEEPVQMEEQLIQSEEPETIQELVHEEPVAVQLETVEQSVQEQPSEPIPVIPAVVESESVPVVQEQIVVEESVTEQPVTVEQVAETVPEPQQQEQTVQQPEESVTAESVTIEQKEEPEPSIQSEEPETIQQPVHEEPVAVQLETVEQPVQEQPSEPIPVIPAVVESVVVVQSETVEQPVQEQPSEPVSVVQEQPVVEESVVEQPVTVVQQTVTVQEQPQVVVQQTAEIVQPQTIQQPVQEQQQQSLSEQPVQPQQPTPEPQQQTSEVQQQQPEAEQQQTVVQQEAVAATENLPFKILFKGTLFKQGSRMQSWKKRFHYLRYYEKEQCVVLAYHALEKDIVKKPLGVHDMWQVYDISEVQSARANCIMLASLEGRKLIMSAENAEEKSMWIEELKRARKVAKNQAPKEFLTFDNLANTVYDTVYSIFGAAKKPEILTEEIRARVDSLRKLQELNDCVWEYEGNVAQLQAHPQIPTTYKDKFGENLGTYYLRPMAHKIAAFCEDSLVKEEFIDICCSSVLVVELVDSISGKYSQLDVRNGALVLQIPADRFMTNTQDVANDFISVLSAHSKNRLPIAVRQNMRASMPTRDEALKRIQAATGKYFTFEADFEILYHTPDVPASYKENMPSLVFGNYLNTLTAQIEFFCQDAVKRQALLEMTEFESPKIVFEFVDKVERGYSQIDVVENSGIHIRVEPSRFCTNVHDVGKELVATFDNNPAKHKITLTERLSIRDCEQKVKQLLDQISQATNGLEFTFEVNYDQICNTEGVSTNFNTRMADKIVNGYFTNLTQKIVSYCGSNGSDKFVNSVTNKRITFEFSQDAQGYNEVVFSDGSLVIRCAPRNFYTNVHQCGSDLADKLK